MASLEQSSLSDLESHSSLEDELEEALSRVSSKVHPQELQGLVQALVVSLERLQVTIEALYKKTYQPDMDLEED